MCEVSDWCMLAFLGVCCVSDLRLRRVRTLLLLLSTILVLLFCIFFTKESLWSVLGGVVVGLLFLGISYITKEDMGYADSWLILVLGAYLGLARLTLLLSLSFLGAALLALVGISLKWWRRNGSIAFIPFLTVAYIGVMLQ